MTDDKKAALAQYDDDGEKSSSSDDDLDSVEDDEEDWELDEIQQTTLPSYQESEKHYGTIEELIRDVMEKQRPIAPSAEPLVRTPLPCPVIIPQRRPRAKARGFVHAYPPLLGECAGIDQKTFLSFLDNFYKSSQASPVFTVLNIAGMGVGFIPEPTAQAVSIVTQFVAGFGQEIDARKKANTFLDKMNEELFKPAGVYAMIVKYKTDQDVAESQNNLLSRLGVSPEKVDFNTSQSIAKYSRTLSDDSTTSKESRGMSDRLKDVRLASGTTRGTLKLPEAAPLIFPGIDKEVANNGPETFKDRAKDAQGFVADYLDRRAQFTYVSIPTNATWWELTLIPR